MKKYEYSSDALITSNKNFKVYFINFIFMLFIGIILTFVMSFYGSNSTYYNENNDIVNIQVEKMLSLTNEAHLSEVDKKGNVLSLNEMYKKYAIGHILLSYELNEEKFNEKGIDDIVVEGYSKITIESDYLANLYYNYLPSLYDNPIDYKGMSGSSYFKKVISEINNDVSMYNLEEEYPSIKVEFAIELYKFIVLEEKMDNKEGLDANTLFADIFTKTFEYNSNVFQKLDFYIAEYNIYSEAYQNLVNYINIIYFGCYFVSFLIVFVFVPFVNRKHVPVGELLSRIVICDYYEEKAKGWQYLIRTLISFILYLPVLFIVCFLLGGTKAIYSVLFSIGSIHVNMLSFILIASIIIIINFAVCSIKKDKRSLVDVLSNTMCLNEEELKII